MSKKNRKKKKIIVVLSTILLCLLVIDVAIICKYKLGKNNDEENTPITSDEISIDIGNGMLITEMGAYDGNFMEDGTDEDVSNIMMIKVKNESKQTIQYAEIRIPVKDREAKFSLSTLAPNSTVILLEQKRMEYVEIETETAIAENVVIFVEPLVLHEDKIKIQILDGAINVSNISGEDITDDITIYYKNYVDDLYYGGITYRIRIEGGLVKDEIRQIMAQHFSDTNSKVMFVTIGAE